MARSKSGLGDGDTCPVEPSHGAMVLIRGTDRQYCPDQSHDGMWTDGGKRPATRAFWPSGWKSFEAASASYNAGTTKAAGEPSALPELDITLEV